MTRAEHLEWAKQRAHEELNRGSIVNAIASMLSDLGKHEELADVPGDRLLIAIRIGDREGCKHWIDGFK